MIIFLLNSGYSFTISASFMHFIAIDLSPNPKGKKTYNPNSVEIR